MQKMVNAYIMPHPPIVIEQIAGDELKHCIDTNLAMRKVAVEIATYQPERIILISPHGTVFEDGVAMLYESNLQGDLGLFNHFDIAIKKENDLVFVNQLFSQSYSEGITVAKVDKAFAREYQISTSLDHGAIVPLWFIDQTYQNFELVHVNYGLLSTVDLYRFGMIMRQVIERGSKRTIVIASGDLSHAHSNSGPYSFNPESKRYDQLVIDAVSDNRVLELLNCDYKKREKAAECGFRTLVILYGLFEGLQIKQNLYSYQAPFGVGYLVAKLEAEKNAESSLLEQLKASQKDNYESRLALEDDYILLARDTIVNYIKTGNIQHDLLDKYKIDHATAGCFVSIKKAGMLRGCIGTITPRHTQLKKEIIENAISAATHDSRFSPIEEDELDELEISVDVLLPPERISSVELLDEKRYGVIIISDTKQAVLLPNLEGIDSVSQQLEVVKAKAGIVDENYSLSRFEVVRHAAD